MTRPDHHRPMVARDPDGTWVAYKPSGNGFNGNPWLSGCLSWREALDSVAEFYRDFPGYTAERGQHPESR